MRVVQVVNASNGKVVADRVGIADGFWLRLRGLLGRKELGTGEGMVLYPCNNIHCIGMQFEIDVVFLDEGKKVLAIYSGLKPGGKAKAKKARYVLEIGGGTLKDRVHLGDQLIF